MTYVDQLSPPRRRGMLPPDGKVTLVVAAPLRARLAELIVAGETITHYINLALAEKMDREAAKTAVAKRPLRPETGGEGR